MRFVGRYKDMLKVGGENVDPMEVEGQLLRHPAVRQVAVVGYPDARLGGPVAFVIPHQEPLHGRGAHRRVPWPHRSFKIPRHVFLVVELPITSSGKVHKIDLRAEADRLFSR